MRADFFRTLFAVVFISSALPAWNQASTEKGVSPKSAAVRGRPEPYVAEFAITSVKTLEDGTTLTQESTEVQAWDSRGRTLTATTTIPESGDETPTTRVRVSDPANRSSSSWSFEGKFDSVAKKPMVEPGRAPCSATASGTASVGSTASGEASGKASSVVQAPTGFTATVSAMPQPARTQAGVTTTIEQLGSQTIEGIEAHGSRVTQTTPSGAVGNSQLLVSSRESWQASVNGISLTVREVDDDPKNGKRITELVKFSLGEELDPASFQPPEGYGISTQETRPVSCKQFVQPQRVLTP